ncbi:DNA polymerase III subunit gamma/tau [Rathayibacter sp. VKM Ac-2759]|uniref:DNA polymerase III subunit gamma/tau n=1 Tax=Rathayibacter sp. VKM Ac-2759 TaxID=2609252 RepID=UPI0013194948|nr:DNA polymerase III subunit gamma/tau [Rathayibacter sp. VKM Ac-2759]QHC66212.1 DNA polymerase III subunit gamma/tau [Rathayibacter sp. VKM Ac-2759]
MIEDRPGHGSADDGDGDDDALSWAGEGADPTLAGVAPRAVRSAPTVRASRAGDADDDLPDELREDGEDDDETSEAEAAAASSVLLVATGVTAGLYLLYTIGWMITATRQNATITASFSGDALGGALYGLGLWLAVAAPATWFAAVLLGTRDSRVRTRVVWLVAGLVLLAPLPFLKGA